MAIIPDDKDWTWVLQRPCPECGFEAAALDVTEVGTGIRVNAAAWPAVLSGADVRTRPDEHTWSPLEYGCHVRDVFALYDRRLRMMLEQDDPLYPNWDDSFCASLLVEVPMKDIVDHTANLTQIGAQ